MIYEPANTDSVNILVEADKRRLTQVISNLLDNAIKFTEEGTVTVSTTSRIMKRKDDAGNDGEVQEEQREEEEEGGERGGTEVIIAVKDTGTGIDAELMPRLFTKFAAKSYQGTGLGLYISKSIIEAHGGKMWAENNDDNDSDTENNGATFYFTLPVVNMNVRNRDRRRRD